MKKNMWILGLLFIAASSVLTSAQIQNQASLDSLAKNLRIQWNVVTNTKDTELYHAEVILQNNAPGLNLSSDKWELHFSSIYRIEPDLTGILGNIEVELPGQDVTVTHLQGDNYYFKPTPNFITLTPGASRKIKLKIRDRSVSRTDSMPNWYLTFQGLQPAVIASTQGEELAYVTDRNTVQQWKRGAEDEYNPYTAQERYYRNFVADSTYNTEIRVIPRPANVTVKNSADLSSVIIDISWAVYANGQNLDNEVAYLKSAVNISNQDATAPGTKVISLTVGDVDVSGTAIRDSPDAYSLTVNASVSKIDIVGKGLSGLFYGIVTLLSIMGENQRVPECVIVDGPRFEYRGLSLDIARNFHSKNDIVKVIKVMTTYKLNKLHLHLSDDEGWRIEIPSLPELTQLGSRRCHDPTETSCLMPQLGAGPENSNKSVNGFLSTSEYLEILTLANQHHVTVIPEIEMPGHARAAILSMRLRNQSNTLLTESGDMSEYTSPQMYSDNALNPCLESTYNFISIVMDEFIKLHKDGNQPLKTFHYGGDEVGQGAWMNSSKCKELRDSGNITGHAYKQYLFTRISKLAASKGLSLSAWEDGLMQDGNDPFNLSLSAVQNCVAYAWNNVWETGAVPRTYTLANQGYKVVFTHASHLYLDHPQEPDPEERGSYWATRFTDTKKIFSYDAENYYENFLEQLSGAPITAEQLCGPANESCPKLNKPENVIGMEGTIFSETIRTSNQLFHNLFPRLLALAERAWHRAPWEGLLKGDERNKKLNDDWYSFARAVGYRELSRLEKNSIDYRIPPPGAVVSFNRLLTTPLYPGLVVQYSLDAGITWQDAGPIVSGGDYSSRVWLRTRTQNSQRFSRTVVLEPTPEILIVNQPILDYIGDNLVVNYTVVDNFKKYGDDLFEAKIRFANIGDRIIPGGNWRIYFISVNAIEPDYILKGREYVDNVAKITMSHTRGYLYSVGPSPDFPGIKPGAELEFVFRVQAWSVSRYEQMPRWYVSSPGMNARNLKYTDSEDLEFVTPFNTSQQWKRFQNDKFDPWTPAARYDRNLAWEVTPQASVPVIPSPVNYHAQGNQRVHLLQNTWTVAYGHESLKGISSYFKETMTRFFPEIKLEISPNLTAERCIHFIFGQPIQGSNNNTQSYEIQVRAQAQIVEATGTTPDGLFYAAVTLIQTALKSHPAGSLPELHISDWPRFSYRGMHVDTGRNFVSKKTILKLLDVMALYKLNKLHFHLTDDEGWRLQIPGLEELTVVGGRRCHDLQEIECVMSTLGSGADDTTSGTGFYTVEDYKEILRRAEYLHIQVIPEFDMPGHAHSAIRSMRARQARLKDLGDNVKSDQYLLNDEKDTSHYFSVQFYTDNAVNPCIDSTYRFIEELFTRVKEIHADIQPLKIYHFGGDEVAKGAWVNSSACADLLRSGTSLKQVFTQRVSEITKDVALVAWEDGLMDHESVPWNRSLLLNKDVLANAWQNVWEWGVASRAYNLANQGYKVIFAPVTHTYFDHPQEPSPDERGFYWGTRYTDAFKTFSFMPDHYYMNADIKRSGEPITLDEICGPNKDGCPPLEKPENILGLQGQLWAETIRQPDEFEYMVYPRILSLAERAWHKASWEGKDKPQRDPELKSDWARFAKSLGERDLGILDQMNVSYRVPPPGVKQAAYTLSAKVEFPGLNVQYRLKNSNWASLSQTVTFTAGQEVTLRTVSANGQRFSSSVQVTIVKVENSNNAATRFNIPIFCTLFIVISRFFM